MTVGVLVLFVAGCGEDERVLSPEELQRSVSATLKQINQPHESVSCPEAVKAQPAESTICTMTDRGVRYRLTVTVKSVAGDQADFDVDIDPEPLS